MVHGAHYHLLSFETSLLWLLSPWGLLLTVPAHRPPPAGALGVGHGHFSALSWRKEWNPSSTAWVSICLSCCYLLMVLKKKFGTRLQKRIMGYELSTGGLVSVCFIQQKALKTTRELGFRMNCDLQLFLFGWFRQLPKQWLLWILLWGT